MRVPEEELTQSLGGYIYIYIAARDGCCSSPSFCYTVNGLDTSETSSFTTNKRNTETKQH